MPEDLDGVKGQATRLVYTTISPHRNEVFAYRDVFSRDNFSPSLILLSGSSTEIYSPGSYAATNTKGLCALVASTFIVKSGRQQLENYVVLM